MGNPARVGALGVLPSRMRAAPGHGYDDLRTLGRLAAAKDRYGPSNFFRMNANSPRAEEEDR